MHSSDTPSLPSPATPALALPEFSFFGRSLPEYQLFFGFRAADYVGRRVLDVAAGPSSFAAEAACSGIRVTAVDPLYRHSEHALQRRVAGDYSRMFAQLREKPELVTRRTFDSIDAAESSRRRAAERFLADYYTGVAVGRYVAGSLPALPFADGSFELALCGHLLFVYDNLLDLDFHIEACRELIRIAPAEVRIHPIVNGSGALSCHVEPLRESLAAHGIQSEIVDVDYEFFRGATRTMKLKRK